MKSHIIKSKQKKFKGRSRGILDNWELKLLGNLMDITGPNKGCVCIFSESGLVYPEQIESVSKYLVRVLKKNKSNFFQRTFEYINCTRKSSGRMGKGKGNVSTKFSRVKAGEAFLYFNGNIDPSLCKRIFKVISPKLPLGLKFYNL